MKTKITIEINEDGTFEITTSSPVTVKTDTGGGKQPPPPPTRP